MMDEEPQQGIVYQDFNPDDVLSHQGHGIKNHPANIRLRNRVIETEEEYEAAGSSSNGKKLIAEALVQEVLDAGGQFVKVATREILSREGGQFVKVSTREILSREDAIASVQQRYRGRKSKSKATVDLEIVRTLLGGGPEGGVEQHDHQNLEAVIGEKRLRPSDVLLRVGNPPAIGDGNLKRFVHHRHAAGGFEIMDTLHEDGGVLLPRTRDRQVVSRILSQAKKDLLDRLSGPNGDEIAEILSSIVDDAAKEKEAEDIFVHRNSTKQNFVALASYLKHQGGKRSKQQGKNNNNDNNQGGMVVDKQTNNNKSGEDHEDDDTKVRSVLTSAEHSKMLSLMSGFSSMNLDEKIFDKLDVPVDGVKYEEGRKTYYGTTLDGQPHGLGFMIVKEKKKTKQAADDFESKGNPSEWPEPPKSGECNRKKIRGQWYYFEVNTGCWMVCDSQDDMEYTGKEKGWEKILWGHWRKGNLHGFGGSIFFRNNHRCFGTFSMNRLHGKGMYITNAYSYLGEYKNHKKHGHGHKKEFKKGEYIGKFRNDKYTDDGKYTFNNGKKGQFKDGKYIMVPSN